MRDECPSRIPCEPSPTGRERSSGGPNSQGIVSTHDLELVHLEKELPNIRNFHFRETIENNKMAFDYKLHPGPCPTTNALKIMQLAGLPIS